MADDIARYIEKLVCYNDKLKQSCLNDGSVIFGLLLQYKFGGELFVHREDKTVILRLESQEGYKYYNACGRLPDIFDCEIVPLKNLDEDLVHKIGSEFSELDNKHFMGACDAYDYATKGYISRSANNVLYQLNICTEKEGVYLYDFPTCALYVNDEGGVKQFIADSHLEDVGIDWLTVKYHLDPSYKWDSESATLTVYESNGIHMFCNAQDIDIRSFDMPVILSADMTDCFNLFGGCNKFNHRVELPPNCTNFEQCFWECFEYNQPTSIPSSAINCRAMFGCCYNYEQHTVVPEGVKITDQMFYKCNKLREVAIANNQAQESTFEGCAYIGSDGKPSTFYSREDFLHDVKMLMKVMEKHPTDFADWFNTQFPNGAKSASDVLTLLEYE